MGFCNCSMPGKGSDSVWFNIWKLCISPTGQRKVGSSQSPDLTALSLGSSGPAPSCHVPLGASEEEGRGERWPSLWYSHPICHPVQWDTHSSGEQSSLWAITGFSETSLLSSGVPKNQSQWSYTSMHDSKLWPWLFSLIVLCWWCNLTYLLGIIVLHSNLPLSKIDSLQAH